MELDYGICVASRDGKVTGCGVGVAAGKGAAITTSHWSVGTVEQVCGHNHSTIIVGRRSVAIGDESCKLAGGLGSLLIFYTKYDGWMSFSVDGDTVKDGVLYFLKEGQLTADPEGKFVFSPESMDWEQSE